MLCIKCGVDQPGLGPGCPECGSFIGYVAEGRGYVPQLQALETGLKEGAVTIAESTERLQRLEDALAFLIQSMDESGSALANLELDEVQQGTLGGFMMPVRDGLEEMRNIVSELDPAGDWSSETWAEIEATQSKILRGNEGIAFMAEAIMGHAADAGVDLAEVERSLLEKTDQAEADAASA